MDIKEMNYPKDMDRECVALCNIFNTFGLETAYSCCGHGDQNFCIIFADTVTTDSVKQFLNILSNKYNHTPLVGSMLLWMRKISGDIKSNWTYSVEKIEWALHDERTLRRYLSQL